MFFNSFKSHAQCIRHRPNHFTNILQCVMYDLTTVSPVYSEDPPVQQTAVWLQDLLVYSETDPVLSGVRGLISELKPKQHNLHLWQDNYTTCREQWHSVNCSWSVCSLLLTLVSEQERRYNDKHCHKLLLTESDFCMLMLNAAVWNCHVLQDWTDTQSWMWDIVS